MTQWRAKYSLGFILIFAGVSAQARSNAASVGGNQSARISVRPSFRLGKRSKAPPTMSLHNTPCGPRSNRNGESAPMCKKTDDQAGAGLDTPMPPGVCAP